MNKTEKSVSDLLSRREIVTRLGAAGLSVATLSLIAGCGSSSSNSNNDMTILNAAATAEALASVMYDNIIQSPLYTSGLASNVNDQSYLVAGREQEAIHYQTLTAAGARALALTFYFPTGMFTNQGNYATTINTLITLEDTFIAAYLIAIRDLSTVALKQLAGQIMGIESEHRVLGRVIAADLGLSSTTGQSGQPEMVNGPMHAVNNLAFERMFSSKFPNINAIVSALGPFVTAPQADGFGSTPYAFNTTSNFYLTESPTVTLDSTIPNN